MSGDSTVKALIALAIGVLGAAVVSKIISDAKKEKRFICPKCKDPLSRNQKRCPGCGTSIRWT